ncbi:hypothetical protein [Granulicella arctica]|uniref:hypothetical protein n=1 Tax=Granulicella arctica TaxID=940613 RepID=UPI0021DFF4F7|nr:hypothetical protein [Granulicella arctica]
MFGWLIRDRGVVGLLTGFVLWAISAVALGFSMRANLAASMQERSHNFGDAGLLIQHLHGSAVGWSLCFTALQLMSLVATAFVLRACYRWRTAACFIAGAGFVMIGDVLGLLGLLVWLGTTVGVG